MISYLYISCILREKWESDQRNMKIFKKIPDDTGLEIINSTFIPSFIIYKIILEYISVRDTILDAGNIAVNNKETPLFSKLG